MSDETFPQTWIKGDQTRLVRNVRERVKAKFDGFKTVTTVVGSDHPVRSEIQAAAKAAGIPANKSTDEIVDALVRTETDTAETQTVEKGSLPDDTLNDEPGSISADSATPTDLDQDPAPAEPDTAGEGGPAAKPTTGKSSTRTRR
jgi:hypothetical protein